MAKGLTILDILAEDQNPVPFTASIGSHLPITAAPRDSMCLASDRA